MSPQLASNLLFDTDQENLFSVDEIRYDTTWFSARVYQSVQEGLSAFEVWFFEWTPSSNEEKATFIQAFPALEEAKLFALQFIKDNKVD